MQDKVSVLIVDDHPLFRQGLREVLNAEPDLVVIGEASDGEEALRLARELMPRVVLIDVNIPTMNGLQVARRLRQEVPGARAVILTGYDDDEQVFHAVRAGAYGYFPKDVQPQKLIEAVREVNGGRYMINDLIMDDAQLAPWLYKQTERFGIVEGEPGDEAFVPLSPREMEILQYITRGLSNKEIAHQLGISHQTVKNHMTSILRKLNVEDRTQAAVYALRRGWVRLQDTRAVPTDRFGLRPTPPKDE
ncbi:MAG TPA: response regulator transcription factor [Anaerolineae bacterium]